MKDENSKNKFYTYAQNSSGGYFIQDRDKGVCEVVIVEARDADEANDRLDMIGEGVAGFWEFCYC